MPASDSGLQLVSAGTMESPAGRDPDTIKNTGAGPVCAVLHPYRQTPADHADGVPSGVQATAAAGPALPREHANRSRTTSSSSWIRRRASGSTSTPTGRTCPDPNRSLDLKFADEGGE